MTPQKINLYGLPNLGYDEDSLGLTGNVLEDQIAIEAICLRIEHAEHEGGLGAFGHFKNYVDLLWNNPDSGSMKRFIWNPWANKMFRKMLTENELSIAGPTSAGKCVHLNTTIRMYDGSVKKASEIVAGDLVRGDDNFPRTVQEVHRGHGAMHKITPATGEPWFCTDNHVHVLAVEGTGSATGAEWWTGHITSHDLLTRQAAGWFAKARLIRHLPNGVVELIPFEIEPSGDDDWVGFSVDHNHHFLLGDYTVTHNSDPAALYAIVRYITDPTHTLILMMSTTIKGAKKRIWKTTREYWESIPNLPGRLLASTNEIRGLNYQGNGYGESSGIYLLAGEQAAEKNSLDKLIGIKAPRTGDPDNNYERLILKPEYADLAKFFDEDTLRELIPRLHNLSQDRIGRLILIIDEATGVSEAILNAVNTNMKPGNVGNFQIICIGNPNLVYDTFGVFSKPKGGWDKVDLVNDEEWETETGGLCIRFNGEKNPRIAEGNERFSWMLRQSDIEETANTYGKKSLYYHRMVLGTWCLDGEAEGVYSPADIEMSGAKEKEVIWGFEPPTPVSFLDPSFTAGGDLAWATFGLLGKNFEGKKVLLITGDVTLKTDPTNTLVPVNYQIVRAWREECEKRKVKPNCAAYDRSGGGIPFGDIVSVTWSPAVVGVSSGGTASVRLLTEKDIRTGKLMRACDRFANKATEIWHGAQPLFRSGQIFGVSDELAKELCSRQYAKGRNADVRMVCVEPKKAYKEREGKSPDQSDSFLGLVDFCREKHGLTAAEVEDVKKNGRMTSLGENAWKHFREKARRIVNSRNLKS